MIKLFKDINLNIKENQPKFKLFWLIKVNIIQKLEYVKKIQIIIY
jgi:hypothetical protein